MVDARTVNVPDPALLSPHRWMVESLEDPHRFRVHRWHRRARKTTLGLNRLLRECAATSHRIFGYIAPTYRQARAIVVRDPMMLPRYLPQPLLAKPFNESEMVATFRNGSVLMIKGADDPDSLRGIGFYGVVLDEWAMHKREIFEEILHPVLTENGGWADFYFTPKGKNHAYDLWRRGHDRTGHPEWRSFDLVASQSRLISHDALEMARKEMGDDLYQQEFECAFLDETLAIFRGLEQCVVGSLEAPQSGHRYLLGVDLGRHHDATVLTCVDIARRHVVAWDRLTETHWALQKARIASMAHTYQEALVVVDSTGMGDPIAEDLRELGVSVEPVTFTTITKRQLVDGLRVALADRLVTFPKLDQLLEELGYFEVHVGPTGQVSYAAPDGEGYYDDSVMSLALAVHGLKGELYVPRLEAQSDAAYEAALAELPANGGIGFR